MTLRSLLALLVLAAASPAWAQTATPVTATSHVIFDPSPDHAIADAFGVAVVASYDLRVVVQGGTTVVLTKNLGKPALAAGKVDVVVPELGKLATNVVHTATVVAVGPGGTSVPTAASNPFGVPGTPPAPRAPAAVQVAP